MTERFEPVVEHKRAINFFNRMEANGKILMREFETLVGLADDSPVIIFALKGKVNKEGVMEEKFFVMSPPDAYELAQALMAQVGIVTNPRNRPNWYEADE